MAPSKESLALADLFTHFKNVMKADDVYGTRCIYDQVHIAASEPTGVEYESIFAADRPAIWIRPSDASSQNVILFMHGGGYTMGSPYGHRKLAAHLAKHCKCIALSVDYRMTPEYPYPTPFEDCFAAYKWLLEQGFSADKIVTAGDSCGGALATAVPLAAKQRGVPVPAAAVSIAPWYDVLLSGASITENAENDKLSTPAFMKILLDRYTADGASPTDPLISPLHASLDELRGLPPHWISCGEYDTLRDQGVMFSEKLKQADVDVVLTVTEGQQHVFEFMAGRAKEADDSLANIGKWVQGRLGA